MLEFKDLYKLPIGSVVWLENPCKRYKKTVLVNKSHLHRSVTLRLPHGDLQTLRKNYYFASEYSRYYTEEMKERQAAINDARKARSLGGFNDCKSFEAFTRLSKSERNDVIQALKHTNN